MADGAAETSAIHNFWMKTILRYIIGFLVGLVSVFIVQFVLVKLWSLFDVTWGPDNLPFGTFQKLGVLSSAFISGLVGPVISLLICKNYRWLIIGLFFLVAMTIDLYAVFEPLKELELWFRIVFIALIPIQLLLAIQVFEWLQNKNSVPQSV